MPTYTPPELSRRAAVALMSKIGRLKDTEWRGRYANAVRLSSSWSRMPEWVKEFILEAESE